MPWETCLIVYHVAVGLVIGSDQEILIAKRPLYKLKGGFWEFPGGKIELGETPEEGLKRELQEEIGIEAIGYTKLMQLHHDYSEYSADLEVFVVTQFNGIPQPLEEQEIKWITVEQFPEYRFLEANYKIINTFRKDYLHNLTLN